MKVIKSTKSLESEYPKQTTCDKCEATLEYDKSDIQTGEYGCAYILCPECGFKTFLDDEEHKELTIENLVFPNDYSLTSSDAKQLSDEEINNYVKECLETLKQDKEEYGAFRFTGNGDTIVFVVKFEDEYAIHVCKNYYETSIER